MTSFTPERRAILANISWLVVGYVLVLGIGWLVQVWMARYLGPDRLGLLSFAISFTLLFLPLVGLGLEPIVIRELVRRVDSASEVLGTAIGLSVGGAVLGMACAMIAIGVWQPSGSGSITIVLIASLSLLPHALRVASYWYASRVESRYSVMARLFALAIASLVRVILILVEAPLVAFAWAYVIESAVEHLVVYLLMRSHPQKPIGWRFSIDRGVSLLSSAWPVIAAGFAVMLYMQIDQVMLKAMIGDHAVGIYAPAVMVFNTINALAVAISASVFPSMVRLRDTNPVLFNKRVQQLYDVMTWAALSIALPIGIASPWLMPAIFGQKYVESGPLMTVVILNCVFVFQGLINSRYLVIQEMQVYIQFACVAAAGVNFMLNLVLIPWLGPMGAAIATLCSYPVASSFGLMPFAKARHCVYRHFLAWLWPLRCWCALSRR